jgi:AcrR family transcriptional regulator
MAHSVVFALSEALLVVVTSYLRRMNVSLSRSVWTQSDAAREGRDVVTATGERQHRKTVPSALWPMTGDNRIPRIGNPLLYRTFPAQGRSRDAVATVLGVAREMSHTQVLAFDSIASKAGVSEPMIYRYFRDVSALRAVLASQELELYFDAISPELTSFRFHRWQDIVLLHASMRVNSYVTDGGPPAITERYLVHSNESEFIAELLTDAITSRFETGVTRYELSRRIETCIRIIDALVSASFGDLRSQNLVILSECRAIVEKYLAL